jgi:signal transduction histidine kinase
MIHRIRLSITAKLLVVTGMVILMTMGILFYLLIQKQERLLIDQVRNQAMSLFRQIVITRRWIADHGGIFVERLPWVKPNPYLADIYKETEIIDRKGRRLVRENPAMVTKELSRYARERGLFWFNITSLKPLNPDNMPDSFESEALKLFESGEMKEYSSIQKIDNLRYFRFIAPLYVETPCLDCHSRQGYRIGDIRGAISITIPVEDLFAEMNKNRANMVVVAALVTLTLFLATYLTVRRFIISPLLRLNTSIKEFAGSDELKEEPLIRTGDELEEICRSFTDMARSLSEYHKCLEERVKESVKDLEESNKKLIEINKELVEINNKKSDFVAKVSHELRTPLTSIKGAMDYISTRLRNIIEKSKPYDENPEFQRLADLFTFFDIIKKNAERLIRLVNDILEIERLEQGKAELQYTEVDISVLVDEVITALQSSALQKGIIIKKETVSDVIVVDEDRIRQVIINLLSNAIKFSPEGSEVSIKVVPSDDCLMVIVKDNGPGIAQKDQERIFDKFYKKGDKEGTGLGLAISRGIVEAHGGIIGVISDGSNGSSFYFKLPKAGIGACRV